MIGILRAQAKGNRRPEVKSLEVTEKEVPASKPKTQTWPTVSGPFRSSTFRLEEGTLEHDNTEKERERWSLRHSFLADMGGFRLIDKSGKEYILRSKHINFLVKHRYIDFPNISTKDIDDRSKSDSLAKAFTCLQIGWLALQVIGRAVQHLDVTTLEITTLSFVVCSMGTYACWIRKPYSVGTHTVIRMPEQRVDDIDLDVETDERGHNSLFERYVASQPKERKDRVVQPNGQINYAGGYTKLDVIDDARPNWTKDLTNSIRWWRGGKERKVNRVRNDRLPENPLQVTLGAAVVSFAYAGLHITAWNISFPTEIERVLWRAVSLILLSSIIVWWCLDIAQSLYDKVQGTKGDAVPLWRLITGVVIAIVYGLARAYLLVEAFVALRALPPSAYQSVNWTAVLPHI